MNRIARGLVEISYARNEYRARVLRNGEDVLIGVRVLRLSDAVSETNELARLIALQ